MTTAPTAAVTTLPPPAAPPRPDLDLTPLLGADPMTAVVFVLVALVVAAVVAAAYAAVGRPRNGDR
jgi:hypothetical protein